MDAFRKAVFNQSEMQILFKGTKRTWSIPRAMCVSLSDSSVPAIRQPYDRHMAR